MYEVIYTNGMTREDWLAERQKGVGGSDAGAIVGLNKYRNALDVYADKVGLVPPVDDNEAMRQGRDLEEYVARRFTEETGLKVRRKNAILKNPEYPWALANVDRFIVGEDAGLECKTANVLSLRRYKNGEYPPEYYCQCQHYMAVTGYQKWYLAVLIFGTEFKIFEIARDDEDIEALMSAEKDFWYNNVTAREMPAPQGTERNDKTLEAIYPTADDVEIQLCGYDEQLKRYFEIVALEKKLDAEKSEIQQSIKAFMGEAARASNERYIISWANSTRRSAASVKELEAAGLDKYIKETQSRRFTIKERTV